MARGATSLWTIFSGFRVRVFGGCYFLLRGCFRLLKGPTQVVYLSHCWYTEYRSLGQAYTFKRDLFRGISRDSPKLYLSHATEELVYREPLRVLKGPSHLLYVSHNTKYLVYRSLGQTYTFNRDLFGACKGTLANYTCPILQNSSSREPLKVLKGPSHFLYMSHNA